MKKTFFGLALCAMLFALCVSVQAQQPAKVPRLGFLVGSSLSANSARIEAFRQGLRELGYVEGKNIVIEWRSAEGKLDRLPALAAELVRLKVDVIVTAGPHANPCRQRSNFYDSHCHGAGSRSGWQWVRRQPGATGREHYWIVNPCPGAKRKTTGAFEGDRSYALPRGRLRDFDPSGQRTILKRDGTRRRSVRSEASIPRRTRVPGILRAAFRAAGKGRAEAVLMMVAGAVARCSSNTDCGPRGKEPTPGDILAGQQLWKPVDL